MAFDLKLQLNRLVDGSKLVHTNITNYYNNIDISVVSDGNTYSVVLDKKLKTLSCNCNDNKLRKQYICKHSAYVLTKILPFYYRKRDNTLRNVSIGVNNTSLFLQSHEFTEQEYGYIKSYLKYKYPKEFNKNICDFLGINGSILIAFILIIIILLIWRNISHPL